MVNDSYLRQLEFLRTRLLPRTHNHNDYERLPNYDPDDPVDCTKWAHEPLVEVRVVLRSSGRHCQPSTWTLVEEPATKIQMHSRIGFIAPNGENVEVVGLVTGVRTVERKWVEFCVDCGEQDRRQVILQVPKSQASIGVYQQVRVAIGILFPRFAPSTIPELPIIVNIRHEQVIWDDYSEGGRAFRRVVKPLV